MLAAGDMRMFCTKVLILKNEQKQVEVETTISFLPQNFLSQAFADLTSSQILHLVPSL